MTSGADARARATAVLARIAVAEGTVDELRGIIEDGIRVITATALRTPDVVDRMSVLRMNAPLRLLAGPSPSPGGPVLGLAAWDGTLYYDEQYVTGPLKEMFDASGVRHDPATLRRYRYALSELLSQNSHLQVSEGSYAASAAAFTDPAVRLMELGVVEAWTARHLDEYIAELEVESVAPGICEVSVPMSYPAYVPAVSELASGIGAHAGLEPDEVLRRLNNVSPGDKLAVAASLLTGAGGSAVVSALRAPLFAMATVEPGDASESAILAASAAAGRQAVGAAVG